MALAVVRLLALVPVLLGTVLVWGQISREEDLKAALLISFVRFTEWPAGDNPVTVGIVGFPELQASATRLSQGKSVTGRAIQVRGVKYASDLKQCHVVYFGATQGKKLEELLGPAQELGLLTISESEKFLSAGGVIHVFVEDGRLQFEVNLTALGQTRLSISSKLLRLGYAVRSDRPAAGRARP